MSSFDVERKVLCAEGQLELNTFTLFQASSAKKVTSWESS